MTQMSMRNRRTVRHRPKYQQSGLSGDKILALIAFFILLIFVCSTTIMHLLLPHHDDLKDDFLTRHHNVNIHGNIENLHGSTHDYVNIHNNADANADANAEKQDRLGKQRERRRQKKSQDMADTDGEDPAHEAVYDTVRKLYDEQLPHDSPQDTQRLYDFVHELRKPKHTLKTDLLADMTYDIDNCPEHPPHGYPMEWPVLDLLHNWNPNDISTKRPQIYQGLCRFDHQTELHKAENYRHAEVPFLIRDDPEILKVVERWNQPNYLSKIMGDEVKYRTEYSETNSLMFFRERKGAKKPIDWTPPISGVKLTYDEWVEKASQPAEAMAHDRPHWYFRVNAKGGTGHFMFKELPFFLPNKNLYIVDEKDTRGINCRFGMAGNTAAAHFDGSRNFVMLFGGERRYILSHPKNCQNLALFPKDHPSARHTFLNWADPDLEMYPEFKEGMVNEVVLQAGDVLYLPTQWFHHIVSLDLNWQCNARSGITSHYQQEIKKCGF
mmetsp:Transcript_1288/g.1983  ORF Transcript_1288/g.1983 Transcript_1288/m.1983 type:complete len:495 (+) Transcript_1288:176-1660(+)